MTADASTQNESLRTSWRDATRHCLLTSFVTHKGGQGRTLGCAHVAIELLARGGDDSRKAPRILVLDLDWSAPGLSYIQLSTERGLFQTKSTKATSNQVLSTLVNHLSERANLLQLSKNHGILPEEARDSAFSVLANLLGNASDLVAEVEVPSAPDGKLLILPAQRLTEIKSAFAVLSLEYSLFFKDHSLPDTAIHGGDPFMAWVFRLFLLYLIHRLELDYIFIDCQAGITAMTWFTATLMSDVVVIPTTMFHQALDGTATLVGWLSLAKAQEGYGREVPYGPDVLLPYISNLPLSLWETADKRILRPKPEVTTTFVSAVRQEPTTILPYVERLAEGEMFVSPSRGLSNLSTGSQAIVDLYGHGIDTLAKRCEDALARKRSRLYVLSELARQVRERARSLKTSGSTIKLRVESGAFGEDPFARLQEESGANGVKIEVTGVEHDELLDKALRKDTTFLQDTDLLAFPHYLLGHMAHNQAIVPLYALADASTTSFVFEMEWLDRFLLARETCFFNGTLYAFPFSVLEKLLLVSAQSGVVSKDLLSWNSFIRWLKQAPQDSFPLSLENDFTRIGVWYDWLEVVAAFGGEDFRREREARGSDYGTCWLNNPATIDGTHAYLRLFWEGLARTEGNLGWEDTIENLLAGRSSACFAWSDILNYRWPEIQGRVALHRIPVDTPTRKRTPIESWVIGVPRNVAKERYGLIESFMAWFLSQEVQRRFAGAGGSPSLRLSSEDTPKVLRLVQDSVVFTSSSDERVAPKISFPEAPSVVAAVRQALKDMVEQPEPSRTRSMVHDTLNQLARTVTGELLNNKARLVLES